MKAMPVLLLLCLIGCGGSVAPRSTSTTQPQTTPLTISAESVFDPSFIGQDWEFSNGYGETNHILIENPQALARTNADGSITQITWTDTSSVAGRTGTTIVMHFAKKSADRTYWGMGIHGAELWFPIHIEADNSGRSTSSVINMPFGCPWCVPDVTTPFLSTFQVVDTDPGMPLPYLITPPTVTIGDHFINETRLCSGGPAELTFDNVIPPQSICGPNDGGYWRTDFYIAQVETPVYSGPAIVSDQFEGVCGHERWYFAPPQRTQRGDFKGGLVKIESLRWRASQERPAMR